MKIVLAFVCACPLHFLLFVILWQFAAIASVFFPQPFTGKLVRALHSLLSSLSVFAFIHVELYYKHSILCVFILAQIRMFGFLPMYPVPRPLSTAVF